MAIICPWCGAIITGRHKICPECGVFLTRLSMPNMAPSPPHARSPHSLWLLAIVPIIFTILLPAGMLALRGWNLEPAAQSDQLDATTKPDQTWAAGIAALRARIGDQQDISVTTSSVQISAGHLITLCGRAKVSTMGGGVATTRFLAMEGWRRDARLEFQDPSFAVLWTRLCDGSNGAGW